MTDPIADLLTRIRNGQRARKGSIASPYSRMRESILKVMRDEGYIREYQIGADARGHKELTVELKYYEGQPVIQKIDRVSKPGRRVYTTIQDLKPYYNHLGISILSTSKGIMSDVEARRQTIGGEILCTLF